MLSLTHGKAVAVVCDGDLDGKTIYVDPDARDPEEEEEEEDEEARDIMAENDMKISMELYALMDDETRAKARVLLMGPQIKSRRGGMQRGSIELKLDNDAIMIPLPTEETERVFIAGKSGSGKSTWAAMYMCEYLRMFPKRRIILLSRHAGERAYQKIKHSAIPLGIFEADDKKDEAPEIELEDIKDSLVVFDDCDNLQNKNVATAMKRLNDDIISNGRKYNIHCLTLAHQLMNYVATRNILNEANRVVFFNTGANYHIERYLREYAGLKKNAIKKICALQSRWSCLSYSMPMYILHEHGIFIIGRGDD